MRIPPRSLALALVASGVLAISTRARAEDTTEVHILAVSKVSLEQLVDGDWVEVCHAPCDERLRVDATYRTHGKGLESSTPFSLVSRNGSAVIEVTPRSDRRHVVAAGLIVGGGLLFPLGVGTLAFGVPAIHGGLQNLPTLLLVAFGGLIATVGGPLLIGFGVMLDSRHPTKVTHLSDAAAANVWTTGLERAPSSATSLVVPILSGTF